MDYDATCLVAGPASPLLNLIGFLAFCAVGLCITRGSGGGGHHQLYSLAGVVLVAPTHGA